MRQVSPAATPCQVSRQAINTIRLINFSYTPHFLCTRNYWNFDEEFYNYFNMLSALLFYFSFNFAKNTAHLFFLTLV